MSIYVTAILQCKAGHAADLKPFLLELVCASRREQACRQYDLHQSVGDENRFLFREEWADQAGLDRHNQQQHLRDFSEAAAPLLEGPVLIDQTEKIA